MSNKLSSIEIFYVILATVFFFFIGGVIVYLIIKNNKNKKIEHDQKEKELKILEENKNK